MNEFGGASPVALVCTNPRWGRPRACARASLKSGPIAERLEKAGKGKDFAAAVGAADEFVAMAPSMARYAGVKFEEALEAGHTEKAYAWAREAIGGVGKADNGALNTITMAILRQPAGPGRDLNGAMRAAVLSDHLMHGKNSRTVKLLAEVHSARGEWEKAVETQTRAVAVAYPEEKAEFEEALSRYEGRAGRGEAQVR